MSLNYDPNAETELPPKLAELAIKGSLQVVHVICDEQAARVGDDTGVSFFAMTPFLPNPGDRIELEDGRECQVNCSLFKIVRRDGEAIALVPNVYATLIADQEP